MPCGGRGVKGASCLDTRGDRGYIKGMTNTECIICDEPITAEFPADELNDDIHELCAMQQESEYDNEIDD